MYFSAILTMRLIREIQPFKRRHTTIHHLKDHNHRSAIRFIYTTQLHLSTTCGTCCTDLYGECRYMPKWLAKSWNKTRTLLSLFAANLVHWQWKIWKIFAGSCSLSRNNSNNNNNNMNQHISTNINKYQQVDQLQILCLSQLWTKPTYRTSSSYITVWFTFFAGDCPLEWSTWDGLAQWDSAIWHPHSQTDQINNHWSVA